MRFVVHGELLDPNTSKRLAATRYSCDRDQHAKFSLNDQQSDDVRRWDTLYRTVDGVMFLWRHEKVWFSEHVLSVDQAITMLPQDVLKWWAEVSPVCEDADFSKWVDQQMAK